MLIPIQGAVPVTQRNVAVVRTGMTLGSRRQVVARSAFSIDAIRTIPARVSLSVIRQYILAARQGFSLGVKETAVARHGMTIRAGEGFLILADLYPLTLPVHDVTLPGGYYPTQYVRPKLTIGGIDIPVIDFDFQKPAGRLGAILNVTVARFDTTGLDPLMLVNFGYMIRINPDADEVYHPRMTNGKLLGRELGIRWREQGQVRGPADSVTISAIDVMADKFSLRPRTNILMFNPNMVEPGTKQGEPDDSLRDEVGNVIPQVVEEVVGLTAYMAMKRAYTSENGNAFLNLRPHPTLRLSTPAEIIGAGVGMGFNNVVCNIPDYEISRVSFTVESGWHNGVLSLFAMYGPLFFDINNTLFIINTTYPLPAGFTPRPIPNSAYQQMQLVVPVKEYTNSVILSYNTMAATFAKEGLYYATKVEQETSSNGVYGQPGYTRTETTSYIRELHYVEQENGVVVSDKILSSQETQSKVTTYAQFVAGDGGGGLLMPVHEEITDFTYAGELKTGHHKSVSSVIATGPDASLELVKVLDEYCTIVWSDTDDPDVAIQSRVWTRIEGMIISMPETKRMKGRDGKMHDVRIKHPVLVAEANGIMTDGIDTGFGPIREITQTLKQKGGNQVDVEVKDIDLINNIVKFSYTQPVTAGRIPGGASKYQSQTRHILLEDADSVAAIGPRIPASISAGELPADRAIKLGKDFLRLMKSARHEAKVTMAGVDITLDRGSVIIPAKRSGNAGVFLVQGISEKGEPSGSAFRIITTLDGKELDS